MKAKPEVREYLRDSERQSIVRVADRRKEGIELIGNYIDTAMRLVGCPSSYKLEHSTA